MNEIEPQIPPLGQNSYATQGLNSSNRNLATKNTPHEIHLPTNAAKWVWEIEESHEIKEGKVVCMNLFCCCPKKMFPWDIANSVFMIDIIFSLILVYISIVIYIFFNKEQSKQKISIALIAIGQVLGVNSFVVKRKFLENLQRSSIKEKIKLWYYVRTLVLLGVTVGWTLLNIAGPLINFLESYEKTENAVKVKGHVVQEEGRRVLDVMDGERVLYASGYEGSLLEEVFCRLVHLTHCLLYEWFLVGYWWIGKSAYDAVWFMEKGKVVFEKKIKKIQV